MERMVTKVFEDIRALNNFVRGEQICTGTMTAGTGATAVEDTDTAFTALDISAGYYVYDPSTDEAGVIESVALNTLTVQSGAWAVGHKYEVRGPHIQKGNIVDMGQSTGGQWYLCYYRDDTYSGGDVNETELAWLMNSGGAAADRSAAFYLGPDVKSAALEIAWTFVTDDIVLEKYIGDAWELLDGAEPVLDPTAGNFGDVPPGEWSEFPTIAGVHTIFAGAPLSQGAFNLLAHTGGMPGWYRLRSASAPGGADIVVDKTFKVITS